MTTIMPQGEDLRKAVKWISEERQLHAEDPWPSNASATATLGSGDNGVVTTTVDTLGTGGNAYTIAAVAGVGNNIPLSAALVGNAITVTLGTNGSGVADPTKNTAILVAGVVTALTGVTATYSGTGSGVIPVTAVKSFSGGSYAEESNLPALIMATQQLSVLVEWTGDPTDSNQRLPWPRTAMVDFNGNDIESTVIPEALKHASFELARLLIISDRTEESEIGVNKMTHLRAGPVTMKFRDYRVYVEGEVNYPGRYPFYPNMSALDLLLLALVFLGQTKRLLVIAAYDVQAQG